MKAVYNDHSTDQVIVVSVDRWSLYRGAYSIITDTATEPLYSGLNRLTFYA